MKDLFNRRLFEIEVTAEEFVKLQELWKRDEPVAMKETSWMFKGEKQVGYLCPKCEGFLGEGDKFCCECGQRIDNENVEF